MTPDPKHAPLHSLFLFAISLIKRSSKAEREFNKQFFSVPSRSQVDVYYHSSAVCLRAMSHDETGPSSRRRLSKGVDSPDGDGKREYELAPEEIGSSFTTSDGFPDDFSDDLTTSGDEDNFTTSVAEDEGSEVDTEFFIKSKRTEKRTVPPSRFSNKKKRNYRPPSTEE